MWWYGLDLIWLGLELVADPYQYENKTPNSVKDIKFLTICATLIFSEKILQLT
jgi:hypothetical protein